jgi:hypothetical protein
MGSCCGKLQARIGLDDRIEDVVDIHFGSGVLASDLAREAAQLR